MKYLLCLGVGYLIGFSLKKAAKPKTNIVICDDSQSFVSILNSSKGEDIIRNTLLKGKGYTK